MDNVRFEEFCREKIKGQYGESKKQKKIGGTQHVSSEDGLEIATHSIPP